MTRIGLISDIHGNLVALDAALSALSSAQVDEVICLGDVALGGPQPRACVARLRGLGIRCVQGNHDVRHFSPADLVHDSSRPAIDSIDRWSYAQLGPDDLGFMRTFVPTLVALLAGGETLLCYHGTPFSSNAIVRDDAPEADLERVFGSLPETVCAGGHSHQQMLRSFGDKLIVNVGSVGLPWIYRSDGSHRNSVWAGYALVDGRPGRLTVEMCRLRLDLDAVASAARASGMPYVDWWLAQWA